MPTRSAEANVGVLPRDLDGNWSASDFARFHGKISNLYAMIVVLNNMDTPQAEEEKGYIKNRTYDISYRGLKPARVSAALGRCYYPAARDRFAAGGSGWPGPKPGA